MSVDPTTKMLLWAKFKLLPTFLTWQFRVCQADLHSFLIIFLLSLSKASFNGSTASSTTIAAWPLINNNFICTSFTLEFYMIYHRIITMNLIPTLVWIGIIEAFKDYLYEALKKARVNSLKSSFVEMRFEVCGFSVKIFNAEYDPFD